MNSVFSLFSRVLGLLLIVFIVLPAQFGSAENSIYSYQLSMEDKFPALNPGQQYQIAVRVQNTSPSKWNYTSNQPINLSYHWLDEKGVEVEHDGARTPIPQGFREAVLKAVIKAPAKPGNYICELDLVQENVRWFAGKGAKPLRVPVTVSGRAQSGGSPSNPSIYSYQMSLPQEIPAMIAGRSIMLPIKLKNTSNLEWKYTIDKPINLSYHWLDERGKMLEQEGQRTPIPEGFQNGILKAEIKAPAKPGKYICEFDLVHENVCWFATKGAKPLRVSVTLGSGDPTKAPVTVESGDPTKVPVTVESGAPPVGSPPTPSIYSYRMSIPQKVLSLVAGQSVMLPIKLKNTSHGEWRYGADKPINISYHWLDGRGSMVEQDGQRTPIPQGFKDGVLKAEIKAPTKPGKYLCEFDLVHENVCWFAEKGARPIRIPATVGSAGPAAGSASTPSIYAYQMSLPQGFPILSVGQSMILPVNLKNMSSGEWKYSSDKPINFSYHWLDEQGKPVVDGERTPVPQGFHEGVLRARIKAPKHPGKYTCEFDLVHESVSWFAEQGAVPVMVPVIVQEFPLEIERPAIRADKDNTRWWCDLAQLNSIQLRLKNTLEFNLTSFQGRTGEVFGFNAGTAYPQVWVRDSAAIMQLAQYYFGEPQLRTWIGEFLNYQKQDGSIYDWIDAQGKCDKNTTESDQESSLVLGADTYFRATNDINWLREHVVSLERALTYLMDYRKDEETGLIISSFTADWGDVSPTYADQRSVYDDAATPKVINFHTNALFCRAAEKLSIMFHTVKNRKKADKWQSIHQTWVDNLRKLFWSGKYYRMHYKILPPDQDRQRLSDAIFPLGSNSEAILAGIPNREQISSIYLAAKQRQREYGISTVGAVLLPPFPENTFTHPMLAKQFSYQNGGQWDWFAGRFVLGLFQNGFEKEATEELVAIAKKDLHNMGFYEWETPPGEGRGSEDYSGSAAVVGQAVIEGLFGVQSNPKGWEVTIRLGPHEGEIRVYKPATKQSIYYHYKPGSRGLELKLQQSTLNNPMSLMIWNHDGAWKDLYLNGRKVSYLKKQIGGSNYDVVPNLGR
ncbi:MAG: hypothetical protein HQK60_15580 [Deltaproteobacteria bacterium]|nr:hypothetical protein [Deltaproteobacteria bacterium]